jgi:hypothetical protein
MSQNSKGKKVGCLGGFFRKRSRSTSKKSETARDEQAVARAAPQMERSRSTDSLMSVTSADITFANASGMLDTFARIQSIEKLRKRHSVTLRIEKMTMTPYFGHFAGQRIYFDLKRNTEFLVNIKVRTENDVIDSLLHRQGRKKETIRDQCIKFALEITNNTTIDSPPSLSFLCEQTIILNLHDIPYQLLPPRYSSQFDMQCQTVTVRVFPARMDGNSVFKMKFKKNLSVREIQWMLSKRLHLSNPSAVTLYIKDSLEVLSAGLPLSPSMSELICIIAPSAQEVSSQLHSTVSICLSLIGKGIKEIKVQHSTTLHEFEEKVKAEFKLDSNSFLYFPDVHQDRRRNNSFCPLRMHTELNPTTSSSLLLDNHKRNFPILHGHLSVSQQHTLQSLLLYKMAINDLDLLKSGPIICFEVTGPTIPIAFKTVNDISNPSDPGQFCLIDFCPHAVSVNPDWTISVLLKYLTRISGFPCNSLKVGSKVLSGTVKEDLLQNQWFFIRGNDCILSKEIPCANPS